MYLLFQVWNFLGKSILVAALAHDTHVMRVHAWGFWKVGAQLWRTILGLSKVILGAPGKKVHRALSVQYLNYFKYCLKLFTVYVI